MEKYLTSVVYLFVFGRMLTMHSNNKQEERNAESLDLAYILTYR